jgi:hypothetical protein
MSEGPSGVMATEGVSEATEAFQSALDAETPSRSKSTREEKREQKQSLEDLFPNRQMDRREREGGAADDPDVVRQRRQDDSDDESDPDDPTEGNDEDEEEYEEEAPDEEEEGEEPEGQELDPNLTVQVMIDGQPAEVTIEEALKGYIRQETFHRRMGELGQGIQHFNVQRSEFQQTLHAHAQQAELLKSFITAVMPQEPDWNVLFNADPGNAAHLKFQWDTFQKKLTDVQQMHVQARQQMQQMENQQLHQFANANRTWLAQQHPEWKSEKTWRRDHDSMRRTARAAGYTDAEIAQLYDARAVTILLKAAAHDRMMAAKPKPVRQGYAPSKRNGSTPSRNLQRSFERAEKRLSRSGSINDAAAVFERILDNEG